jgi:hypothetical protein
VVVLGVGMVAGYLRVKRTGSPWARRYLSLEGGKGLLAIREREGDSNATSAARGEPPGFALLHTMAFSAVRARSEGGIVAGHWGVLLLFLYVAPALWCPPSLLSTVCFLSRAVGAALSAVAASLGGAIVRPLGTEPHGFVLIVKGEAPTQISCGSEEEKAAWIKAIKSAAGKKQRSETGRQSVAIETCRSPHFGALTSALRPALLHSVGVGQVSGTSIAPASSRHVAAPKEEGALARGDPAARRGCGRAAA